MKKFSFIIIALAAVFIALNYAADYVIYRPLKEVAPMPKNFKETVIAKTSGETLYAALSPAKPGKETIILFHGNAGNISYYIQFAEIYSAQGFGVFMFDYGGFGKSEGGLNQESFFEDAKAALDHLITKENIPPQKLILFAHSLGNAALLETALAYNGLPFKALIMQSPFTNTPDMAASFLMRGGYHHNSVLRKTASALAYPFLFNKLFNNIDKIRDLKNPVFIIYSRQDMLIPWEMSDALFKSAPAGSRNFISPHGGHNNFEWSEKAVSDYLESLPETEVSSAQTPLKTEHKSGAESSLGRE